jgi:hypothetical protein
MKAYWGEQVQQHAFLTSISGQLHAPSALLPRKEPPVPIVWEVRWAPEPGNGRGGKEKNF